MNQPTLREQVAIELYSFDLSARQQTLRPVLQWTPEEQKRRDWDTATTMVRNAVLIKTDRLLALVPEPPLVDPKDEIKTYDREYFQVIGELGGFFVINGKAFPSTDPIEAKLGERVRIRLVNLGEMVHPMHSHGFATKVVSATVLIFFLLIGFVFWLATLHDKKNWDERGHA